MNDNDDFGKQIFNIMLEILQEEVKELNKKEYSIEIGVVSDNKRKGQLNEKGVTNAELLFIHENGSPLQGIPKRPVLDITINGVEESKMLNDYLDKAFDVYFVSNDIKNFEKELKIFAMRTEYIARNIIYSNAGFLAPNAPSTIRKKGDNHPLFDTGQLARSIICRVVDKGGNVV